MTHQSECLPEFWTVPENPFDVLQVGEWRSRSVCSCIWGPSRWDDDKRQRCSHLPSGGQLLVLNWTPAESRAGSKTCWVFCVLQSVPSHCAIHREAESLHSFLQLPAFPPVTCQSLLHPARLSLRYLIDANLPGKQLKRSSLSTQHR